MKKVFISAGLVAVGAAGLQTALAADSDIVPAKFWSVSGTLRGFYDDNYNCGTGNNKQFSSGVEVSPSVSINVPLQQTDFGLRYTYGAYYYQQRSSDRWDQTHQVDAWMDHKFNENWKVNVSDTMSIGQEPELQSPTPAGAQPVVYRVNNNYLANHGDVTLDTDWTRLFSTSLHYANGYFNYDNSGATTGTVTPSLFPVPPSINHNGIPTWNELGASGASLAGLLNRIEESASLDLQWHIQPETMVFIGYSFAWANYTGNEPIAVANYYNPSASQFQSVIYNSSSRNNYTQYGYVGFQQEFTPNLNAKLRLGASYIDTYNDPLYPSTSWNPYADLSLSYTYLPGSYVQLGMTQDVGATDVVQPDASGKITQYAKNSVVYADIKQQIIQKLTGTVIGRIQYSEFDGGAANNSTQTAYGLGVNLHYQFNQHWGAEVGYNYDDVVSDAIGVSPSYNRNREYIGVNANF